MVMPEGGRGCRKVDEARKVLILTRFARRWTDRNYVMIQTLPKLGSRVRIPSSAPFFCLSISLVYTIKYFRMFHIDNAGMRI